MRVFAAAPVWVRDDCPCPFEHNYRPPLLCRLSRSPCTIGAYRLDSLASQPRHLARVRGKDTILAKLRLGPRSIGQCVKGVSVNDQWARDVLQQIKHQAPGGAVASQAWADHSRFSACEVTQH